MTGVIEFTGKVHFDLTGMLPFIFFRGNRQIMVMHDNGINAILTEAIKTCEGPSIVNAYGTLYNSLATKGLKSHFQKLDKEASTILIQSIKY